MLWTHLLWTTLSHLIGMNYCGHCLWLTFLFVNQAIPRKKIISMQVISKQEFSIHHYVTIIIQVLMARYLAFCSTVNLNVIVVWHLFGTLFLDIGFDYNALFLTNFYRFFLMIGSIRWMTFLWKHFLPTISHAIFGVYFPSPECLHHPSTESFWRVVSYRPFNSSSSMERAIEKILIK